LSDAQARTPPAPDHEALMAENVDLDEDTRRTILSLHARLNELHHYALLGVERDADRKGIKRAYYDLAGKYHPDRYFRKNLGSFKVRMEAIFSRMTLAHDTLSDRERRADYDAYLDERLRTQSAEHRIAEALEEAKRVEQAVERDARAAGDRSLSPMPGPIPGVSTPGPSPSAPAGQSGAPPSKGTATGQAASSPVINQAPNVDVAARRDALARRLLGGRTASGTFASAPANRVPSPPAAAPQVPATADAMESLKRRYEERVSRAKSAEAKKYVTKADAALAAGDVVNAANAYRVAATLLPGDAAIAKNAEETQAKADAVLAETYLKQAVYEERNAQWGEASRSWSRVCKARPGDARAHERAAHALLQAGGDMHDAGRFAKRACELEPKKAAMRVLLARVYIALGHAISAKKELETAAQLAPQDDTIRTMLKQL
jgi:curved DNA-binding protein CbpA